MRSVKSLDALQGLIPPKAWLTTLKVTDKLLKLEGFAMDDLVIADFMQNLSSSIYFSDVRLEVSEDVRGNDEKSTKRFSVTTNMENM